MKIKLHLTGTSQLVMHNAQLSDPLNDFAKQIGEISALKKKTEANHREMSHLEFLGGLYIAADGKTIIMPAANIKRCLQKAATATKEGKAIERAMLPVEQWFPLDYVGMPMTPEQLYADKKFVLRTSVRVGANRVQRTRPVFIAWQVSSDWELVDMNLANFERVVKRAGDIEGLGDHRTLGSGRFSAKVTRA